MGLGDNIPPMLSTPEFVFCAVVYHMSCHLVVKEHDTSHLFWLSRATDLNSVEYVWYIQESFFFLLP